MGEIFEAIEEIRNSNISREEKNRREATLRAQSLLAKAPPVGKEIKWGVYSFVLTEPIVMEGDMLKINGTLKKNNSIVPASPPFYFKNPPYVTRSTGVGEFERVLPDGTVVYYEENPEKAILEMLQDFVSMY